MQRRTFLLRAATFTIITIVIIFTILTASLSLSGCAKQRSPPYEELKQQTQRQILKSEIIEEDAEAADTAAEEETETVGEEKTNEKETKTGEEEAEIPEAEDIGGKIVVEPVREAARYEKAEPEPSKEEKDSCGCSFTWDPVCGIDGKTYVNKCLFQCFGNSLDLIKTNSKCPKKQGPPDIYVDDIEFNYEADKWNAAYCWRMMYRESGIRYCKNLIVNGRVDEEPEPLRGNWLDSSHLVDDLKGKKDSYTIKLNTGQQAENEEYDILFQPLFEPGRYRLSFWAKNGISANNDWKVRLTLKDWWDTKPRPPGVKGCYKVWTYINGNEHFFEGLPNKWRHYHYEFNIPVNLEEWDSNQRVSEECEYDWDMIPHGYAIQITGPTIGEAWFDDFVLEKIK